MASLPRSWLAFARSCMAMVSLPRSCHDLGKDTMAMQDSAKPNHDLGKDAQINHVLDKSSMVANSFFLVTLSVRNHAILAKSMLPLVALDVILVLHLDVFP